jgi:hypothetical protein
VSFVPKLVSVVIIFDFGLYRNQKFRETIHGTCNNWQKPPSRSACWTALPNSLLTATSQDGISFNIYVLFAFELAHAGPHYARRSSFWFYVVAMRSQPHSYESLCTYVMIGMYLHHTLMFIIILIVCLMRVSFVLAFVLTIVLTYVIRENHVKILHAIRPCWSYMNHYVLLVWSMWLKSYSHASLSFAFRNVAMCAEAVLRIAPRSFWQVVLQLCSSLVCWFPLCCQSILLANWIFFFSKFWFEYNDNNIAESPDNLRLWYIWHRRLVLKAGNGALVTA